MSHEARVGNPEDRRWLLQESGGLLVIFTSIGKTVKSRRGRKSVIANSQSRI